MVVLSRRWQCQRHSYRNITTLSVFDCCTPTGLLVPVSVTRPWKLQFSSGNAALSDSDVKSKYILILRAIQAQRLRTFHSAAFLWQLLTYLIPVPQSLAQAFVHLSISGYQDEMWSDENTEWALQYKAETVSVLIQYRTKSWFSPTSKKNISNPGNDRIVYHVMTFSGVCLSCYFHSCLDASHQCGSENLTLDHLVVQTDIVSTASCGLT